jgi:hypothetical protein
MQIICQLKARPKIIDYWLILLSYLLLTAESPLAACDQDPTFSDGLAPQRYLHVATSGSDATGDGSSETPYATTSAAARVASPGTAIVVHAGQYTGGGSVCDT